MARRFLFFLLREGVIMKKYVYDGPIMEFGRCVQSNWHGETMANSDKKAKNNLIYRWKKENNRESYTKIILPNEVRAI
jgi:hypothetical protein